MAPKDPIAHKASFLAENQVFTEQQLPDDSKSIGKIEDIDLVDNEVWFLQCPKGMDLKQLESQKLKLPGRTNLSDSEAVSVEFNEGAEQHAFAYCNRKGVYNLRLLPVRGTIVLRNRLRAADPITEERIEECCPPAKRVPMPSTIRVRHPLLGNRFEEKLDLDGAVVKRLLEADKNSAQMLKNSLIRKITENRSISEKPTKNDVSIAIDSEEDEEDAVVFIGEEVIKDKKNKRNHSESMCNGKEESAKKKKSKKSKKSDVENVSIDLRWLQDL